MCDSQVLSLLGGASWGWSRTEAEGVRGRSNSTGAPVGCTNYLKFKDWLVFQHKQPHQMTAAKSKHINFCFVVCQWQRMVKGDDFKLISLEIIAL